MPETVTEEMLAMMRRRAEQEQVLFNPKEILALLDRISSLEAQATAHHENDREALDQLARVVGWTDGGPGWIAAIDAVAGMKQRIEALERFRRIAAKVARESTPERAMDWLNAATSQNPWALARSQEDADA